MDDNQNKTADHKDIKGNLRTCNTNVRTKRTYDLSNITTCNVRTKADIKIGSGRLTAE